MRKFAVEYDASRAPDSLLRVGDILSSGHVVMGRRDYIDGMTFFVDALHVATHPPVEVILDKTRHFRIPMFRKRLQNWAGEVIFDLNDIKETTF